MGIKERRDREKVQRQNDILDAAEKVFFEKGYNAATMDDVAEEAELSKGTLYLYFKNREELYFGLTHRALLNLRDRFQKVLDGDGTGLEKVTKIGRAFHAYSQEEPDYYKTIAQFEMAQLGATSEGQEVEQKCHQAGKGVMEQVAAAIIQGIEDGSIRKDVHPLKTAFLLQGLSNGVIQLMAREGKHVDAFEDFEMDDLMDEFIQMMIRALEPN
ncbi:TetR/AcrR family transcriptional regulator [candidate division KSB1 bacterium]|nr:TetR/AcrR family transcriptional regulator [candidate division KSB1 bacterium]